MNLLKSSQPKKSKDSETNKKSNLEIYYTSDLSTSKVYQFENLPEPRNANEGKLNFIYLNFILNILICLKNYNRRTRRYALQFTILNLFNVLLKCICILIAFHSKPYSFNIPNNSKSY